MVRLLLPRFQRLFFVIALPVTRDFMRTTAWAATGSGCKPASLFPSRDRNWQDMLVRAERANHELNPANMNRLIYGDTCEGADRVPLCW